MHTEVKHKISSKSAAGLKMLLFRLWLHSNTKGKRKIESILGLHHRRKGKRKHHKIKHHRTTHRHYGKKHHRGKLSKSEARRRFLRLLPKINAGRRRKGLKPIRVK